MGGFSASPICLSSRVVASGDDMSRERTSAQQWMEDDVSKVANEPREEGEAASEEAPLPRKSALKKVRDREGGS